MRHLGLPHAGAIAGEVLALRTLEWVHRKPGANQWQRPRTCTPVDSTSGGTPEGDRSEGDGDRLAAELITVHAQILEVAVVDAPEAP